MTSLPDAAMLWPPNLLRPAGIEPGGTPFSRSSPVTMAGIRRGVRSDRGFWKPIYRAVPQANAQQRRLMNILGTHACGIAGLLAIPIWSSLVNGKPEGTVNGRYLTTHSDGTSFSDHSRYSQPAILVENVNLAAIGDTSITLRAVHNIDSLDGVFFSYQHALYRTGGPTAIDDDEWTLPIFPSIRAPIPADAMLEFDMPTCLVHLATDRELDVDFSASKLSQRDVNFVEATDYWVALALAA